MNTIISAVLIQIIKWALAKAIEAGGAVDWAALKSKLQTQIRDLLPSTEFDDVGAFVVGVLIDIVAAYFQQPHLQGVSTTVLLQHAPIAIDTAHGQLGLELGRRAYKVLSASPGAVSQPDPEPITG